ncbi:DUF2310 family Zn-ribbon-containing protein [Mucilaginibacter sp. ZT4R22]|uniref:DUF2310 family Zn-ribbon-containing protein n=1 Tax=Mucilaginibacter pankratovii TaxID=2772110 RepID=A0ABR7WNK7_9SPHI|nr:DUF2310 family Zn-ribbon-containing protein [Mucilaginibacter pankratovii]MBD1363913.1 DUF2310 family Zn-ribbon-containing protein [Mucilaginibacter pankratovii]
MYKYKIYIAISKANADKEKLSDQFIILLESLCSTGQIMGGIESPYISENEIICYQTTLEKTSLDAKYNDEWVNKGLKELEEACNSKLIIEFAGQHVPFYKDVCSCAHHDSYVLFTTYSNESSPINCGTCGRPVPIYKIQELADSDRYEMESWEGDYISCDNLNMGCAVGEKWAINQLSNPTSQLSQLGRRVCNQITEKTKVSTYYYLLNYRTISLAKDKLRKCPCCNGEWLLNEKWLRFYDFKCDNCLLVSTLSEKS